MARDDLHFRLRIPEELKKRVESAADENNRSMTAEIIARIEGSFDPAVASEEAARLAQALEKSEAVRDIQAKLIEITSQKNDAIIKAALLSERQLLMQARAIEMAANGDPTELNHLVEIGRQNPASLRKLISVLSIMDED